MSLNKLILRNRVSSALSKGVVRSFLKYVNESSHHLWSVGNKEPDPNLVHNRDLLAVYKDIIGSTYDEL